MKKRVAQRSLEERPLVVEQQESGLDLLSDQELEAVLFEEADKAASGPLNLPTIAGVGLITVALLYVLQSTGLTSWNLGWLMAILPWLACALIVSLVFGTRRQWSPLRRKRRRRAKTRQEPLAFTGETPEPQQVAKKISQALKKPLRKTDKRLILGVSGGIAEYFGIDPTLVRVITVLLAAATSGFFILIYLILAMVMGTPDRQGQGKPPGSGSFLEK